MKSDLSFFILTYLRVLTFFLYWFIFILRFYIDVEMYLIIITATQWITYILTLFLIRFVRTTLRLSTHYLPWLVLASVEQGHFSVLKIIG